MNIWKQIDDLKRKFDQDFKRTQTQVTELGGGKVRTDEFGFWRCSWRPTFGDRHVVRVRAQRGEDLVARLKEVQKEKRAAHEAAKAQAKAQAEAA